MRPVLKCRVEILAEPDIKLPAHRMKIDQRSLLLFPHALHRVRISC